MTRISVLVAVVVGAIEGLQVISSELNLGGPFMNYVHDTLDLGNVGFYIVRDCAGVLAHLHAHVPGEEV